MPVFTTAITGSTAAGVVALSGSVETTGFFSSAGFGNSTTIDTLASVPENYNSVLYGPITVGANGTLKINNNSIVKIKDIEDI